MIPYDTVEQYIEELTRELKEARHRVSVLEVRWEESDTAKAIFQAMERAESAETQVEELTRERDVLRGELDDAQSELLARYEGDTRAEAAEQKLSEAQAEIEQLEAEKHKAFVAATEADEDRCDAEARLARVVGALTSESLFLRRFLEKLQHHSVTGNYGQVINGYAAAEIPEWEMRQRLDDIDAALAAARDQPTQEKLPLGHPYSEGAAFAACVHGIEWNQPCGQLKSAHQPTQETR